MLKNIENIVREEQNKAGADRVIDAYNSVRRSYGLNQVVTMNMAKKCLRIQDRGGREMLYGPTNEELITDIFQSYISFL